MTRSSNPSAKHGISRDWVTLLLKATHLASVPSKGGNLKLLRGAGTLAGTAAAATMPSTTRRATSAAVISGGEMVVASEMKRRG